MILYNLAIRCLQGLFWVASPFHTKAKAFVTGRKGIFDKLAEFAVQNPHPLWMHCASLGEFEQGRPVLETLRHDNPGLPILVTFFSPSGYEIRKNYQGADGVFYLPLDTPSNASRFVDTIRPRLAIFVKYEFWYNYSLELHKRQIHIVSISCIFRRDQVFFKWYGSLFRKILGFFDYFFVQNTESIELLKKIGITKTALAGDTRFDRVYQIVKQAEELPIARRFKDGQKLFVIGSCWQEDLHILTPFIARHQEAMKFILAPHEISEEFLSAIERTLEVKTIRYSVAKNAVTDARVLLIDNIGMLSRLYAYGEFAYVGGAFGKGLHNILEAACYGIPIFFGNKNFQKFKEATDLIMRGGAFDVANFVDLEEKYESLNNNPQNFLLACDVSKQYVTENLGATRKIIQYCKTYLKP